MSKQISLGRCKHCSTSADTGFYGNLLTVDNCVLDTQNCQYLNPQNCHRCDVTINHLQSRYECKYVSSIEHCIDELTVCTDPDRCVGLTSQECQDTNDFCNRPKAPQESYTKLGFDFINDGMIMWNLQLQISKCGTARTRPFDNCGTPFPQDQGPECLPFSENYIEHTPSTETLKCPSGEKSMFSKICTDPHCTNVSNPNTTDCCISESNCIGTVIGCDGYKAQGYKLCQENPELESCGNPCVTLLDYPETPWKGDICYYMCPTKKQQKFWFVDTIGFPPFQPTDQSGCTPFPYNPQERVCSEEYYNLCKLAGCAVDPDCEEQWTIENGGDPQVYSKNYPFQFPMVINNTVPPTQTEPPVTLAPTSPPTTPAPVSAPVPPPVPPGQNGDSCSLDSDCLSGWCGRTMIAEGQSGPLECCEFGIIRDGLRDYCILVETEWCFVKEQCVNQVCSDGKCGLTIPDGQTCEQDDQCINRTCGFIGSPIDNVKECCEFGKTQVYCNNTQNINQTCSIDEQCKDGRICIPNAAGPGVGLCQ